MKEKTTERIVIDLPLVLSTRLKMHSKKEGLNRKNLIESVLKEVSKFSNKDFVVNLESSKNIISYIKISQKR